MPEADGGQFVLRCQSCQAKIKVPASAAGKKAKCPCCGTTFRIASTSAAAPAPTPAPVEQPAAEPITFNCDDCGAKIKVPGTATGRHVKCPKCAAVLTIPAPAAAEPSEDELGFADEDDDLLSDLAAAERSAEALSQPDLAAPAAPPPGFQPPAPVKAEAGGGAVAAAGAALGGLGKLAGSLVLGCLLCAVGAAIGAAIWSVVAIKTGYEIGYIALVIGGLAGFGMALGFRRESTTAGVVASLMSIGAILAAKVVIFIFVIYAVFTGDTSNVDLQRAYVTAHITEELLDERGAASPVEREAQWESAWAEAEARAEGMSDEEVRRRLEEYRETDQALTDAELEGGEDAKLGAEETVAFEDDVEWDESEAEISDGEVFMAFVATVFRPLDLLFLALAVVAAFRVGARGLNVG